jgi:hypothetical protein
MKSWNPEEDAHILGAHSCVCGKPMTLDMALKVWFCPTCDADEIQRMNEAARLKRVEDINRRIEAGER